MSGAVLERGHGEGPAVERLLHWHAILVVPHSGRDRRRKHSPQRRIQNQELIPTRRVVDARPTCWQYRRRSRFQPGQGTRE